MCHAGMLILLSYQTRGMYSHSEVTVMANWASMIKHFQCLQHPCWYQNLSNFRLIQSNSLVAVSIQLSWQIQAKYISGDEIPTVNVGVRPMGI